MTAGIGRCTEGETDENEWVAGFVSRASRTCDTEKVMEALKKTMRVGHIFKGRASTDTQRC